MALLDAEMAGFWAKLPLIRALLLAHPEVEFLWWMDSDAMFTDMAFELPWERYGPYNLVMHGWDEMVYDDKNWIGLNTGSFLLRNCQWSLDMLDTWAPMGPKGPVRIEAGKVLTKSLKDRPVFEADDQSAMVYILATQREKWGDKVYLENGYYLHGYWGILVDRYEEMLENYKPGLVITGGRSSLTLSVASLAANLGTTLLSVVSNRWTVHSILGITRSCRCMGSRTSRLQAGE